MIECVFTLDYEIYGDGTGSLQELVYDPTNQLADLFHRYDARFVVFVEAAELARIDEYAADPAIGSVKEQVRSLARVGFEIGLHLHPWWCNGYRQGMKWILDHSEYNLCTLSEARISAIVSEAIGYLQSLVGQPESALLSFRAGNWLFQPTEPIATVLVNSGIRVDSSVFRGGRQHNHGLDYRRSPDGHYFWRFSSDVTAADPRGRLIEIPIHTEMTPFWRMQPAKRLALGNTFGISCRGPAGAWNRMRDFLRPNYPVKLDFSRLPAEQMIAMLSRLIVTDRKTPEIYRPIVAIGHSKDLSDISAVGAFLAFLRANNVAISTFRDIYPQICLRATTAHLPA